MVRYETGELQLELVCEGLRFPEGPVWMKDGSIILVEIAGRCVSRIRPDGQREVIAHVEGGPNGAAIGPDGRLFICNNGGMKFAELPDGQTVPMGSADDHAGGSIQTVDLATGVIETLYRDCDGRRLSSPNDLVFDTAGGFYFSDMGRSREHDRDIGALHYARADGSMIKSIRRGLQTPNGVGLSPSGERLYCAETMTSRVWCLDVTGPGEIAAQDNLWVPGTVFGPLPGYQLLDSLAVDSAGNVVVATLIAGCITSFAPDGSLIRQFPVPDMATTNICFGGPDLQDAWITASAHGRLYKTRWERPGTPLAYYA